VRRALLGLLVVALLGPPCPASADGPPSFRRTTPRASLADVAGVLVIGVPSARAWGIESALRPLPGVDAVVVARISVSDPGVDEAFLRVAYYASATARTRQLAITDSASVPAGRERIVVVPLDPPPGAVAYRVRVLARTADGVTASEPDAIRAAVASAPSTSLSRLVP